MSKIYICNYEGTPIKLTLQSNILNTLPIDKHDVLRAIMEIILWWECHEAFEKFEFEQTKVFDPHSPLSRNRLKDLAYYSNTSQATIFDAVKYQINVAVP